MPTLAGMAAPAKATKGGPQQQWQHAVAGCTAGLTTVLALQPLDVIKTRLQGGVGWARVARGLCRSPAPWEGQEPHTCMRALGIGHTQAVYKSRGCTLLEGQLGG